MFVLGIEGTAHTLGVGIIDEGFNVLAAVSYTHLTLPTIYSV